MKTYSELHVNLFDTYYM